MEGTQEQKHDDAVSPAGRRVIRALEQVRLRLLVQLLTLRTFRVIAIISLAAVVLGILDYVLWFPVSLRWLHLCVLLGSCAILVWRWVWPVVMFRPSLTDLALRIERRAGAAEAGLSGVLAAGSEFAKSGGGGEVRNYITSQAAERYAQYTQRTSILDLRSLWKSLGAAIAVMGVVAVCGLVSPMLTWVGVQRTLSPWAGASWPKRTQVFAAETPSAHALGTALPLRAVLTRSHQDRTDVKLYYTVEVDGERSSVRSALTTDQNKRAEVVFDSQTLTGELYERLLDPQMLTLQPGEASSQPPQESLLTYWFETVDDATAPVTIRMVPPPSVVAASAVITLPQYAASVVQTTQGKDTPSGKEIKSPWLSGEVTVIHNAAAGTPRASGTRQGTSNVSSAYGTHQNGVIGPVLAGSSLVLDLTFNKPMWVAKEPIISEVLPGFEGLAQARLAPLADDRTRWRLSAIAQSPARAPFVLVDEHNISGNDDASLRVDVVADRAPAASIIDPSQDESVLATAVIPITAEGRDDVGITDVILTSQVAIVPADSAGAPPEASTEPTLLAKSEGTNEIRTEITVTAPLDISLLKVKPGDEVWLIAAVHDLLLASTGADPVNSPKRRLRIISEGDFVEQVQAELSGVREAAKRAEEEQGKLSSQRDMAVSSASNAQEQSSRQQRLSERLAPMRSAVDRLAARVERNKIDDPALQRVLEDAQSLTQEAREASENAADALDRLAARPQENRAQDVGVAAAAQQAQKAQHETQERLADLASILDRGQDDWVVRRAIEKMASQQDQLRQRTATLEDAVRGKSTNELTQQEREDLERLSKEQREMSARASAMISSIEERAKQLKQNDPAQAQGLEAAAQTARREDLADRQQKAAEQLKENKTSEAQQSQTRAGQTLQQMMQQLDKSERNRDQTLRRVLADVTESIRSLITSQEKELARLSAVLAGNDTTSASELALAMITLHENTLAVQTKVKQEVRGSDELLLPLLTSAGQAQTAAIVSLRHAPPDLPESDANERTSLARLRDSLAAAEKMDDEVEEREEDRKRDELKKLYTEVTELQAAINAETSPLYEKQLNRRDASTARAIGVRQEELRQRVSEIRSNAQEMSEAQLFIYAHTRYDAAAESVVKELRLSAAPASVRREQATALRILQGLLAALDEAQKQRDEFKEEEGGGGGGGGGGEQGQKQPLIPPIAELRLLRTMQAEALERTRALENATDARATEELAATATLQEELAKRAGELLEKLKAEQENEEGAAPAAERN